MSEAKGNSGDIRDANVRLIKETAGFDVVIVCTGSEGQEAYWQQRLNDVDESVISADAKVLAVNEDWPGGAGNGLGTLYAYAKAVAKAQELFGMDLNAALEGGASVALYHTAGKGTRLAPLPGSESNNKPGVKLPGTVKVAGETANISILEAVIQQTGLYAASRSGRLSVFWGDQVFIPSCAASYTPTHHADIMCMLRPMPSAEEWAAEGLDKYGLIAVNAAGDAAQVEKVTHAVATELLKDGVGDVTSVGTSLGSFSVSARFLTAMMQEYASELEAKQGKLDTDPHFWMPLTLSRGSYLSVMGSKGVAEEDAARQYDRMAAFAERFTKAATAEDTMGMFGAVDVGTESYWWDYGQLKLYYSNNMLALAPSAEANALRLFLGIGDSRVSADSAVAATTVDETSCILSSKLASGSVTGCCISNVQAAEINAAQSLLVNVSARKVNATGALLYNVCDDSEEGVTLGEGEARADVVMPDGTRIVLLCRTQHDGRVSWKAQLDGNSCTFEDIYKRNLEVDTVQALQKAVDLHRQARATL